MPSHTARSLFLLNMESATQCVALYDGVKSLKTSLQVDWVLRAGVVFIVSALDTYFHDKVKYRVGKFSLENLPPALAKFEVPVSDLATWDGAQRKGNVLRNWVTSYLKVRPLQSPFAIAEALRLAGIISLWDTIEPDSVKRRQLLETFNQLVRRRNQIAHEGDRQQSRKSGKQLRRVDRPYVIASIDFAQDVVNRIETAFPR
jgi:hypothetical protein